MCWCVLLCVGVCNCWYMLVCGWVCYICGLIFIREFFIGVRVGVLYLWFNFHRGIL